MAQSLHLQRNDSSKNLHIFIKPYKSTQIWLETKSNKFFESTLAGDPRTQRRYLVVRTNQPVSNEWFHFKENQEYAKIHLGLIIENKGPTYTEISCSVDRLFHSSFVIDVLHAHKIIKMAKKLEPNEPGTYPSFVHPVGWQKIYNMFQYIRHVLYIIIKQIIK
jgi:hypothetical protein